MLDSCCNISIIDDHGIDVCPTCQERGKSVGNFTVNALVVPARSISGGYPGGYPDGYYCANPDCETLYFFEGEHEPISKNEVSVRVAYKEKEAPTTLCYCYNHSLQDIEAEIDRGDEALIEAQIRTEVEKGACTCEMKNPQGRCCLGEVRSAYTRIAEVKPVV